MNHIGQPIHPRDPAHIGKIVRKRGVCGCSPVVARTRVRAERALHYLKEGASVEQFLADYPGIAEPDVEAAVALGKAGRAALVISRPK